jgi:hypothetical protein
MKLPVTAIIGAALASCVGLSSATWKFHVKDSYLSDFHLILPLNITAVPMQYNVATQQVMRILPADAYAHDRACSCDSHSSNGPQPNSSNLFQAFHTDFTHKKQKTLDGLSECPIQNLNVFYEYVDATASSKSSASSESKEANSEIFSHLVTACPGQVAILEYPCLSQRCSIVQEGTLKAVTSEVGESYILYQNSLSVIDGNCHVLRSIPDFCSGEFGALPNCSAQDIILDEYTQTAIIGFGSAFVAFFDMATLDFNDSFYLLNAPSNLTYALAVSAMSQEQFIIFRAYVGSNLYLFTRPDSRFSRPTPVNSQIEPDRIGAKICIADRDDGLPVLINDFKHGTDIIVSKERSKNRLFYMATKLVDGSVLRQCSASKIPDCFKDSLLPFTGAKNPNCNSFFLGFKPSLNMLHISYEDLVDVKASPHKID